MAELLNCHCLQAIQAILSSSMIDLPRELKHLLVLLKKLTAPSLGLKISEIFLIRLCKRMRTLAYWLKAIYSALFVLNETLVYSLEYQRTGQPLYRIKFLFNLGPNFVVL